MLVGDSEYGRWVGFLRSWARQEAATEDADRLPALQPSSLPTASWASLAVHLTEALSARLQSWNDALSRSMSHAHDEFSIALTLSQSRTGLYSLRFLAGHPHLPSELTERLLEQVDAQVRSVQQQLEEQVTRPSDRTTDPSRSQSLLRVLRENSLTAVLDVPGPIRPARPWQATPATEAPRRRIVTD